MDFKYNRLYPRLCLLQLEVVVFLSSDSYLSLMSPINFWNLSFFFSQVEAII